MRSMKHLICFKSVLFACCLCGASLGYPNVVENVSFDRIESNLIVEFMQSHDMLDPTQSIVVRIFGDGRVEVDLPKAYRRTGQFELMLEQSELDDLVASIVEGSLAQEVPPANQGLTYISDTTRTRITLNIDSFSSETGQVTRSSSGPIVINETDLGIRAGQSGQSLATTRTTQPDRTELLFSVEQRFIQLSSDSRLVRR